MDGTEEHLKRGWPGSEGQKPACSLSFMEYRPNTNVAIVWNTGYTKGRTCRRGVEKLQT
jgi:hypothetical protein